MGVGLVLLACGLGLYLSGDGVERNCFAFFFCDTYEGSEDGAALAFGLIGIAVGIVALIWGVVVWFVAPIVLSEAPRDPNRPPDP